MSIASTQQAMGYVEYTRDVGHRCTCCDRRRVSEVRPGALRCVKGGFYVTSTSGCSEFTSSAAAPVPAGDERIQIGPTDV